MTPRQTRDYNARAITVARSPSCLGMPGTVAVELAGGYLAVIDEADAEAVCRHAWHVDVRHGSAYARRTVRLTPGRGGKKSSQYLHHVVLPREHGLVVDHINHETLDNRRCNLRLVTPRENTENTRGRRRFKGAYWNRNAGRWEAAIGGGERKPDGRRKRRYIGLFDTAEEAAAAYDLEALRCFGAMAALNFPERRAEYEVQLGIGRVA